VKALGYRPLREERAICFGEENVLKQIAVDLIADLSRESQEAGVLLVALEAAPSQQLRAQST
jgi:hypothetical protein